MKNSNAPKKNLLSVFDALNPTGKLIDEREGLMNYFAMKGKFPVGRRLMNIGRIISHAPLLSYKILKAKELKIIDLNGLNPIVNDYLRTRINQNELIKQLSSRISVSPTDYLCDLMTLSELGMVEFHPSDRCNANCTGCINAQSHEINPGKMVDFPFEKLYTFRHLNPKTMILVGGGEPTIYWSGSNYFPELIEKLTEVVPGIRFGLVTNGIFYPEGNRWNQNFDFVRISIGAADAESYKKLKGNISFKKVLDNSLKYIESSLPAVTFNYSVHRNSFDKCIDFALFIFNFVKTNSPRNLNKCSIHYRPLVYPPNIIRITGKELISDNLDVLADQIEAFKTKINALDMKGNLFEFIIQNTNLEDCLQGSKSHNPAPFDFCPHAVLFGQIRTNGNIQPCNVRADDPEVRTGNILTEEGLVHLCFKQFEVFLKKVNDGLCTPQNCRRHGKNSYLMELQQDLEHGNPIAFKKDPNVILDDYRNYRISRLEIINNFF